MEYKKRKHNAPISTVIKCYLDKESGKVSAARKEIEWRFNALDWRYQKQILFAFLQSGKSDREWAYKKMYAVWDDCFVPVVKELWEQHHEKHLSWLVIHFFPKDYLRKEFESLSEGRNYYFLYQRLHDDHDFVLDRTRLNEADLLAVRHQLGETIADDEIIDLFFLLIYKLCKGIYEFNIWGVFSHRVNRPLLTIFDHPLVRTMTEVIFTGLERTSLDKKIREWMSFVTDCFIKEYENEICLTLERGSYIPDMMKEHCLKYIASKYRKVWETFDPKDQQRFLDDLANRHKQCLLKESTIEENTDLEFFLSQNHSIHHLFNHFDLEIEEPKQT